AMAEAKPIVDEWGTRQPETVARLQLCLGKREDALHTMIASLANPLSRTDVVRFIQPQPAWVHSSAFAREMKSEEDWLRANPALHYAVSPFGTRLDWTMSELAPKEIRP
nr:hypothetical protein [Gemmatimonadaceae bacterium]